MTNKTKRTGGGFTQIPNRWIDAGYMAACPGSVTQVYLHLSRWADNESDEAAQPLRLISLKCGVTEAVARRALRILEDWNVIHRSEEPGENGVNIWTLLELPSKAPEYPGRKPAKGGSQSEGGHKVTGGHKVGGHKVTGATKLEGHKVMPLNQTETDQTEISDKTERTESSPAKADDGKRTANSVDEQFAEFWKAYPKKVAKPKARAAFGKAIKKAPLSTMMKAMKMQAETRQWQEGFIPHPTTWLNGERWEDEIQEPVRAARSWRKNADEDKGLTLEQIRELKAQVAEAEG